MKVLMLFEALNLIRVLQCQDIDGTVKFRITTDSDPYTLANEKCTHKYPICKNIAIPSMQLYQFESFGKSLSRTHEPDVNFYYNRK